MHDNIMHADNSESLPLEYRGMAAVADLIQKYPEESRVAIFTGLTVTCGIGTVFSIISLKNKYKKCA